MNAITRRDALTSLFGAGYIGLRALATGLPVWYLLNPRRATAQDLECAIAGRENAQYLIVSASSAGDPIGCNCPGTYEDERAIHPEGTDPNGVSMAPVDLRLGQRTYRAAGPWAQLSQDVLDRTSFFHHVTLATVHGDQPKVMRLMGATNGGEMIVSAYAKHLAPCLGTIQAEPVAVGARGNASELLSFAGRALPSVSPTQLRELLTGSVGRRAARGGGVSPLVRLRSIRDAHLDRLNALAKEDACGVQAKFLDAMASSQARVRQLAESLADTLSSITADDVSGQALAAAALISANVTPVVTLHVPFGGDNHTDNNLQNEIDEHVTGVQGIQAVMDAVAAMGLRDRVTFSTLNVFGRNLNGIDKTEQRQGRDHYGNHSVAVMIGKNIAPGVIGGVLPIEDRGSNGALGAAGIDSATGAPSASGDVGREQTHVAMAKTLGVALGIPSAALDSAFVASANSKVIPAALTISV